jgi:hypothetical protein
MRAVIGAMAERLTRANPEAQAGFFFALQTLTRSAPHRTIVAISLAAASALPFITLARSGMHRQLEISSMPLGLFGIQIIVLGSLVAGFRYAVSVPAELASNWSIRMAWFGDERDYLSGVKRAAIAAVVTAPLMVLLPVHIMLFGFVVAVIHSLYGFLFAMATLDGMFLEYRRFPFACSFVPIENPKLVWPAGIVSLLLVTYGFAYVERFALQTATRTAVLCATLGAIVLMAKVVDRVWRRERLPVNFDEEPAPATQRLGLFERMAGRE